jgi:hypothetical protein
VQVSLYKTLYGIFCRGWIITFNTECPCRGGMCEASLPHNSLPVTRGRVRVGFSVLSSREGQG